MKCSVCRVNDATIHIRNDVNGAVTEMHVCPTCAAKKGMVLGSQSDIPNPFVMDTPLEIAAHPENLIAQMLKQFPQSGDKPAGATGAAGASGSKPSKSGVQKAPPVESLTGDALVAMEHLTKTGRFRRAEDYTALEALLGPMLQEIQAGRQHRGKAPSAAHIPQQTQLLELKKALTGAIAAEDYEQAAALRDQIHSLESRNTANIGGTP